jgi:transposase
MSEEGYSTVEVRIRAVQAVERGGTIGATADAFGIAPRTLHRWLRRYERNGENGLERQPGSGRPRVLEELQEEELRAVVLQPASAFGYETDLWTVGRLHQVIQEQYQVAVSRDTVWKRLREAGLTYQKPEREYYELDEEARQQWQRHEIPRIRRCVEKYRAILYFQDESNVSLTAFLGKTWAPCGQHSESTSYRPAGRRGRDVGHQPARASLVSVAGKTHRLRRGDRLSLADAETPSSPSSGCGDGSSPAPHFSGNYQLH